MKRLLISILMAFIFIPFVRAQQVSSPEVGWTVNGELWIADGDDNNPLQVASGALCCGRFSPLGTRIAYLYDAEGRQKSLVIMNGASPYETMMVATPSDFPPASLPVNISWQNENLFWVNTVELLDSDTDPYRWRWDLWRFQLDTGDYSEVLLPGEGGLAYPYGDLVAIVNPGAYGDVAAAIVIYDLDMNIVARYEYPAVSTGTDSVDWMPAVEWVNGAMRFAVPDPDLVYVTAAENITLTRLVEFRPDTLNSEFGDVEMTYPADAAWSHDGDMAAYARNFPEDGIHEVAVYNLASGEEMVIAEDAPVGMEEGFFRVLDWGERGLAFYFSTLDGFRHLYFWSEAEGIEEIPGYLVDFDRTSDGSPIIARSLESEAQILVLPSDGLEVIIRPEFETWGDFRLVRR